MALTKTRLLKHDLHFHGLGCVLKTQRLNNAFWPIKDHFHCTVEPSPGHISEGA